MLIYRNNKKRCMKKLLVVLAILFIGILLAGCTSQPAAPVATPVPTAVPTTVVTTAPPTAVPTKEIVVVVVNKTANVTATPTATPTSIPTFTMTFTQDLTVIPGTSATVPVGGSVTWVNADPYKPHTVMATDSSDGGWIAGSTQATIPIGGSLVATFTKAGTYEYSTVYQPYMTGVITVK
jgi:plastocyanin